MTSGWYNNGNFIIPAEDNPRDFRGNAAAYVFRGSAEEANEGTHHSRVETDRQKEGYPTELWRERQNQQVRTDERILPEVCRRLRGYNQLVKGQRDRWKASVSLSFLISAAAAGRGAPCPPAAEGHSRKGENVMRMMLVGAGAVGECILKVLKERGAKGRWLSYVLIADYDGKRAEEVQRHLEAERSGIVFASACVDAHDRKVLVRLMQEHRIDFVMDAASPFVSNCIFDAAYEAGADYASMGTWSVPKEHPAFGTGFEGSYLEPMTKYNFDRHEAWKEKGQMACICLGIDPGVVNVFAKYAAEYLFDELYEVHIKDGGNLTPPESEKNDILFGFNPWTVLDEVMNPNAEWDREKGFLIEDAFAGEEEFRMPEPFGMNRLVKVEHEEVVTLPRYLGQYGLRKASFKIALDENLLNALKVIDRLGLRSLRPVEVDGVRVIPRDVVAACAPKPQDIGADMTGGMCVGAHCIGVKDGKRREYFIYQPFDNEDALQKFGMQAVVAQTGFGAALGIELIARGIWRDTGVFSPEYFPSRPFMELMKETGLAYGIEER